MIELKNKWLRIRKPQRCEGCGLIFQPGAEMRYFVYTDDELCTYYLCNFCNDICRKWNRREIEFTEDFLDIARDCEIITNQEKNLHNKHPELNLGAIRELLEEVKQ